MPYIDYSQWKIIITAGIENGEYVLPEMSREEAAIAVTHTASLALTFTKDDNFENIYKSIDKTINNILRCFLFMFIKIILQLDQRKENTCQSQETFKS